MNPITFKSIGKTVNERDFRKRVTRVLKRSDVPNVPPLERYSGTEEQHALSVLLERSLQCCGYDQTNGIIILLGQPFAQGAFGTVGMLLGFQMGKDVYAIQDHVVVKQSGCNAHPDPKNPKQFWNDEERCGTYVPGVIALRVLQSFPYKIAPHVYTMWISQLCSGDVTCYQPTYGYAVSHEGTPLDKLTLEQAYKWSDNIFAIATWTIVYMAMFDLAHYDSSLANCTFAVPFGNKTIPDRLSHTTRIATHWGKQYSIDLPAPFRWIDFDRVRSCHGCDRFLWTPHIPSHPFSNRHKPFQFKQPGQPFGVDKSYQDEFYPLKAHQSNMPYAPAVSLFFFTGSFLFYTLYYLESNPSSQRTMTTLDEKRTQLINKVYACQSALLRVRNLDDLIDFATALTSRFELSSTETSFYTTPSNRDTSDVIIVPSQDTLDVFSNEILDPTALTRIVTVEHTL